VTGVAHATLRPGYVISRVIKGGWQLAGGHGPVDRARAVGDMLAFVDAGIVTFDCADIYTGVEAMIGEALATIRRERGRELADRVKVHTKLVPDLDRLDRCHAADLEAVVDRSLDRLGVERLDLVQFFWWDLSIGTPVETLASLAALQDEGKIHHLGVTNWDVEAITPFVDAGLDIVSAQVQYSLIDDRPAGALAPWCAGRGIGLLCYGVLAGGFLSDAWVGRRDPGFAFENRSLVKYRLIIDEMGGWDLFQALLGVLERIAARHGVTVATVAARYVLDLPGVAAVIVGARYADRLSQTLAVFDLALDDADRAAIAAVLAERRGPRGPVYGLESDRGGRHGAIMKYNLNAGAAGAAPDAP